MHPTEVVFEPGRQDVVVRRAFDAPARTVFAAWSDPLLVPRWWGASRFETRVDAMDVRRGGSWRFVARNRTSGTEYAFRGVYHDVVPASLVVSTFEFEPGGPGYLQLVTDRFTEADGTTTLTSVALFTSVEDRDLWIPTDMETGLRDSMDRLAAVVEELR